MELEKRFGRHWKRYEVADELSIVVHNGPVSAEEMRAMNAYIVPMPNDGRFRWILVDARSVGTVEPAALRAAREAEAGPAQNYIAYLGGSFASRTLIGLFVRAAALISGRNQYVVRFFEDEAQARSWLREERRRALATLSSGSAQIQ